MVSRILSVDIGGTKIAGGIIDPSGNINQYQTIPTNAYQGAESLITRVIQFCKTMLAEIQAPPYQSKAINFPSAIGISSAGQIDSQQGKVIFATENLPGWTGMEIKKLIEAELQLPTFVENDVNCMALGELTFGAGKGYHHLLCMTIGTGIGGAIIVNGSLYRGWKGSAGELGHLCIDYQGRQCICGAHGCLEAYVAGPAIEREFIRKTSRNSSIPNKNGNSNIRLEDIVKLAQDGNIDAQAVIKDAGYYLGCGLYGLLNTLNPEIVIIGGGVVNTGAVFLDEARRVVSSKALSPMKNTPVVAAKLEGACANLIGAAVSGWQQLGVQISQE